MKKEKIINFIHSGNLGDVLYALSGIKSVCDKNNARARIYLWLNRPAAYYDGAVHPVVDDGKIMVMLNSYMFNMAKPLLEAQEYIESCQVWEGQEPIKNVIDLNRIRQVSIGIPGGDIKKWYTYLFPDMCFDPAEQVIFLPKTEEKHQSEEFGDYILVNRTERYRSTYIGYLFLNNYPEGKVLFAGTIKEFDIFRMQVPNVLHCDCPNFLELAYWIKNAKAFIGNQSMCFSIAEQMKSPRILEVCSWAQNVIVSGPNGYDFYAQEALEYYVEKLWKGEKP